MRILFFCPRWGQEQIPWPVFCQHVKNAGYDGVEVGIPEDQAEKELMLHELEKHELQLIGQHWETVHPEFKVHFKEYEKRLWALAAVKPLIINTQTGKDFYSFEQNAKLITLADTIAEESGIPILHETHRGKFSFAAHITKDYLERMPDLRITLDISHWFSVAESFLQDQQEAVELAISRTDHIHSRVGFTEGPQVPDPRAPEWEESLQYHLACWDQVVTLKRKQGKEFFSCTSEFGPAPYMPMLPYGKGPVANQWEVNLYMMELLKARYKTS